MWITPLYNTCQIKFSVTGFDYSDGTFAKELLSLLSLTWLFSTGICITDFNV